MKKLVKKRDSGIYKWENIHNGKVYIGSAARGILVRYKEYKRDLPNGKCHNTHLQKSWNKYGSKKFTFSVLERCSPSKCLDREEHWIRLYNSTNSKFGYNKCSRGRSALGVKRSDSWRENRKHLRLSSGHKEILKQCNIDRVWKPDSIEKLSNSTKNLWNDPLWRSNQVSKRIGKMHSESTKKKMSVSRVGRRLSEETKSRMSEETKQRLKNNPEELKRIKERLKLMSSRASKARWEKHRSISNQGG